MSKAEDERLWEVSDALLKAVWDIRAHLEGPPAPDAEVRAWPLYAGDDGIWCGDDDCPLQAEGSEIGWFREGTFTLDQLHAAIGEHIARQRERERD
jgi:hypothetical protein